MNIIIIILLLATDAISVSFAWWLNYIVRFESGYFSNPLPADLIGPMIFLTFYWWFLFTLRSMYRTPVALSRFDEMVKCFGVAFWGILILFIATFDTREPVNMTRIFLISYGLIVFILTASGRAIIRTFQRHLRIKRISLWNAVIVGSTDTGRKLYEQLHNEPVWGFRVVGFISHLIQNEGDSEQNPETSDVESNDEMDSRFRGNDKGVLNEDLFAQEIGRIEDLPKIIREKKIDWVMVAPETQSNEAILEVFDRCAQEHVRLMIVANYYQMVIGLVRSAEIHGLPLVEVAAQFVSLPVRIVKRVVDIIAGFIWMVVLVLITPIIAVIIKLDSAGPIFYRQKRVGRVGKEFYLYKFRSMRQDAEKKSGAVWAARNDPRITKVGHFLRRFHLDEIPQFFNILKGDMSLVGPRPERLKFVEEFKSKIPLYKRRLLIRPGITGWAQVRHKYDETFEDVKEKTRYDLFYMNHISLSLDLRIILSTFVRVFQGEGH